jgi:hypothetical protein
MSGEGVTVPKYSIPELTEMIDSVRQLGTVVTLTKTYPRWHQLLIKTQTRRKNTKEARSKRSRCALGNRRGSKGCIVGR